MIRASPAVGQWHCPLSRLEVQGRSERKEITDSHHPHHPGSALPSAGGGGHFVLEPLLPVRWVGAGVLPCAAGLSDRRGLRLRTSVFVGGEGV